MILKNICLLILLILYIKHKKYFQYKLIQSDANIIPDIVISPAGRYGMYSLGICHYIKNNFNIKNKKIVGFSAGAWNALFMCMKKKYINNALKEGFKIQNVSIQMMLKKTINIVKNHNIKYYNLNNLYIGICHFNKHTIYNNFTSLDDVIQCCVSSSFVPFITYNDIMYFYKNKLSFDGGIYYKKYKKTLPPTTLIISFKMFGRHKKSNLLNEQFKKNKQSAYQLYIKGYHDAMQNHSYFEKYFNHDSSS